MGGRPTAGAHAMDVTTRSTSLFPDTKPGTHVLPMKEALRLPEQPEGGVVVRVHLTIAN